MDGRVKIRQHPVPGRESIPAMLTDLVDQGFQPLGNLLGKWPDIIISQGGNELCLDFIGLDP